MERTLWTSSLSRMLFAGRAKYFQPPRTGGGIMLKGSRPQLTRALEKEKKPSEFGLGSEVRCNPDDLRVELVGYWSRLLLRVKKQREVVDREQSAEEVRS